MGANSTSPNTLTGFERTLPGGGKREEKVGKEKEGKGRNGRGEIPPKYISVFKSEFVRSVVV